MDMYFTIKDVASKLALNHKTIRRLIRTGQLEAIKVGTTYRISENSVRRYVESVTVANNKSQASSPGSVKHQRPRMFKYL